MTILPLPGHRAGECDRRRGVGCGSPATGLIGTSIKAVVLSYAARDVIALLRERRHALDSRRLPNELHTAREEASIRRGDKTEEMRRAMLHYRAVIEKMVGMPVHGERDRESRREMA